MICIKEMQVANLVWIEYWLRSVWPGLVVTLLSWLLKVESKSVYHKNALNQTNVPYFLLETEIDGAAMMLDGHSIIITRQKQSFVDANDVPF